LTIGLARGRTAREHDHREITQRTRPAIRLLELLQEFLAPRQYLLGTCFAGIERLPLADIEPEADLL